MIDYSQMMNAALLAILPWALLGTLLAVGVLVARIKLERWLDRKLGRDQGKQRRSKRR